MLKNKVFVKVLICFQAQAYQIYNYLLRKKRIKAIIYNILVYFPQTFEMLIHVKLY